MSKTAVCTLVAVCVCVSVLSAQGAGDTPSQQKSTPAAPSRPAAQLVNIRVDLTITDQRDGAAPAPKTVTLVVADRDSGRIRTGLRDRMLNVDARPEVVRDGRVRVFLSLEYRPDDGDGEKPSTVPPLVETLAVLLDDGKPLLVSQSADPASSRIVKVELKATLLK